MRAYCVIFSLLLIGACDSTGNEVSVQNQTSVDEDRRAIEALNQHNMDAVMAQDIDAVISQWTEDFVVISDDGPIIRGRDAMVESIEPFREAPRTMEPLEFVVDFEEITVTGDYAFAWGTSRSSSRHRERRGVFQQRQDPPNLSTPVGWVVEDASHDGDQ